MYKYICDFFLNSICESVHKLKIMHNEKSTLSNRYAQQCITITALHFIKKGAYTTKNIRVGVIWRENTQYHARNQGGLREKQ